MIEGAHWATILHIKCGLIYVCVYIKIRRFSIDLGSSCKLRELDRKFALHLYKMRFDLFRNFMKLIHLMIGLTMCLFTVMFFIECLNYYFCNLNLQLKISRKKNIQLKIMWNKSYLLKFLPLCNFYRQSLMFFRRQLTKKLRKDENINRYKNKNLFYNIFS